MISWKSQQNLIYQCGIYGIYTKEKLLYIGSTHTSFVKRLSQHNKELQDSDKMLYKKMQTYPDLTMRPLIITDFVHTNKTITPENLG